MNNLYLFSSRFDMMNEATPAKKCRQGRRSERQVEAMVEYFISHPHVASGKFVGMNGREKLVGSWEELAVELNSLQNPMAKEKNVKSWKECWRDLKSRTSKKAAALRVARRKTGNAEIDLPPLTALDNKVLGIMGWDYAEGMAECPDAFPEEQDQAIDKLMGGDDSVLNALPVSMTAREGDMPDPMLLEEDEIELPVVIEVIEDAAPVEQGESPSVAIKRKGWQERPLSG
ncbi:uncharacterized protein LOC124173741 isoform X1 [Ischnura elegans]|uniref:uncharacterized protein LOC124173741 isoform X1 n=1 Tax=Ischnura elegans TaxID=197161 RepID=UPI001ED8B366|nr:uncharacterized protein LOC124173741 isoform X1 [Ischnura elegans]